MNPDTSEFLAGYDEWYKNLPSPGGAVEMEKLKGGKMKWQKFRKKPIIIEALQLRWDTWSEMCDFIGVGKLEDGKPEGRQDGEKIGLDIPTLEGLMRAEENDWIIKGIKGEFYPCKPDIFEKTYELVKEAR